MCKYITLCPMANATHDATHTPFPLFRVALSLQTGGYLIGNHAGYITVLRLTCIYMFRATCSQMNITLQVNTSLSSTCSLSNKERIFIFIGVCVVATALNFARIILFYFICVNASRVLHNRMLSTIFRVPVRFFDTNPVGMLATCTSICGGS